MKTNYRHWQRNLVFLLGFFLLFYGVVLAEPKSAKKESVRIKIQIAGPPSIEGPLFYCLQKQIRKFDDIKISDDNPDWILDIIAAKSKGTDADSKSYIFSVVVRKPLFNGKDLIEGHDLSSGYLTINAACKDMAIRFLKGYLGKKTEGVIKRYE